MTTDQPKVNPAGRYSVSDTCRLLGIHRNTLLNHTKKGDIIAHYRKANRSKFYTGMDITKFWIQTI